MDFHSDGAFGAGDGLNSFASETLVHTRDAEGAKVLKPIGQIRVGDEVLSWSEWKDQTNAVFVHGVAMEGFDVTRFERLRAQH